MKAHLIAIYIAITLIATLQITSFVSAKNETNELNTSIRQMVDEMKAHHETMNNMGNNNKMSDMMGMMDQSNNEAPSTQQTTDTEAQHEIHHQ